MNILIISPSEISRDPRVQRHVDVARDFGSVTTCGYGDALSDESPHVEIGKTSRILSRSLLTLGLIQMGLHQRAARRSPFYQACKKALDGSIDSFDAVVVNDVHALQVALDLFPPTRIWADMHEYAPREGDHDWRWRVVFKRHIKRLCFIHLRRVAYVTSVGKGICEQYEKDLGRQVLLLRNTSKFFDRSQLPDTKRTSDERVHLVHVGVAIRARHLENMILATKQVQEVYLHLFILPTELTYFEELEKLCSEIENVTIESPLPVDQIVTHIAQYDAGVIAIPPTSFNYENGLPNKLFQYIQARLPVITGPLKEIAELVETSEIGIVATDFDVKSVEFAYRKFIALGKEHFKENIDKAAERHSEARENEVRRHILASLINSK